MSASAATVRAARLAILAAPAPAPAAPSPLLAALLAPPPAEPTEPVVNAKAPVRLYSDAAILTHVAPNPKKPGSSTHGRWANYVVGESLGAARRRGTTAADIRWDLARGLIRVG